MWMINRFNEMISEFSKITGITEELILGKSRKNSITDTRHLYWYFLNEKAKFSVSEIAKLCGLDHSSITHGIEKIRGYLDSGDKWTVEMWNKVKNIEV